MRTQTRAKAMAIGRKAAPWAALLVLSDIIYLTIVSSVLWRLIGG